MAYACNRGHGYRVRCGGLVDDTMTYLEVKCYIRPDEIVTLHPFLDGSREYFVVGKSLGERFGGTVSIDDLTKVLFP